MGPFTSSTMANLPRKTSSCQVCKKSFRVADATYSALKGLQANTERLDVCTECWEKARQEHQETHPYFWRKKSQITSKKDFSKKQSLDEKMLDALRKALEADDQESKEQAVVACLYLVRRRIVQQGEIFLSEQGEWLTPYYCKATEETFLVPKLAVKLHAIDKERVFKKLSNNG